MAARRQETLPTPNLSAGFHPTQPSPLDTIEIAYLVRLLSVNTTPNDPYLYKAHMSVLKKMEAALDGKGGVQCR